MHQKKGKKILFYFTLLIVFGSINNIKFSNLNLFEIKKINVSGLSEIENQNIINNLKSLNLENIFFLNGKEINNIIKKNNLIEDFKIFKKYPSTLEIKIKKTNLLARIYKDGLIFNIGSNGKLSNYNKASQYLPFVFGKFHIDEFLKFKNIIDDSKFSYDEIKNLYFYQSKRWDIELKNNIILKLSENQTKESLNIVFNFLKNNNLKNIDIVDLRVKNQIIINE